MMRDFLTKFRELVGHKILFINIAILVAIKFAVPLSGLQLADLYNQSHIIDSRQIIADTNSARAEQGLPPLKPNAVLDLAAYDKLNDMIKNGYFSHLSPAGISPWHWFAQNNYEYRTAGENLAVGFTTSSDTVKAWLSSSGHRANLLNDKFEEIGVATAYGNLGQSRQGVVVVQLFGTPKTTTLASNPQATPLPTITPAGPSAETTVLGESTNTEDKSVEESLPSVTPKIIAYETSKVPGRINLVYIFYMALVTVALGISIMTHGFHRRTFIMAGAHLALIAVAVYLPAIETAAIRLIV